LAAFCGCEFMLRAVGRLRSNAYCSETSCWGAVSGSNLPIERINRTKHHDKPWPRRDFDLNQARRQRCQRILNR
jgi:hypothetical protein